MAMARSTISCAVLIISRASACCCSACCNRELNSLSTSVFLFFRDEEFLVDGDLVRDEGLLACRATRASCSKSIAQETDAFDTTAARCVVDATQPYATRNDIAINAASGRKSEILFLPDSEPRQTRRCSACC